MVFFTTQMFFLKEIKISCQNNQERTFIQQNNKPFIKNILYKKGRSKKEKEKPDALKKEGKRLYYRTYNTYFSHIFK